MSPLLQEIFNSILTGDHQTITAKVEAALASGLPVSVIVTEGMIAAMDEVGKKFECGSIFVPEMMIAARAMKAGMAVLKPHLKHAAVKPLGKVIIGTVKGDLHDIGKNLVSMMLEGAGFEIIDLGINVEAAKFVESYRATRADMVALSSLLTATMPNLPNTIQAFHAAGLRPQVKIIVGGAPITEAYAKHIGADGYAADASRAVALAKSLIGLTSVQN